jgi:hypothetical protein
MGEAGRRAVRERFNWNVERLKLLDLYQEILGPLDCNEPEKQSQQPAAVGTK